MVERYVDVPGGRLSVHDFGDGPAIVLLHADIVDAWVWEPLTPFLLDAGHRVVAFDRRGIGGSTTEDVPYSPRADAITVLDALGLERAALVGNSTGGQIALDTALEFPERVAAVVAIGSIVPDWWPGATPAEEEIEAELERVAESGDPDAITEADVRAWVDGPGQSPERVPEDIRELVREMDREIRRSAATLGRPVRLEPPASEQLDRLKTPVLAIAGALDFSYLVATARYLEESAPNARAVVVPGVAHLVALEAPEELGTLITEFLSSIQRWS